MSISNAGVGNGVPALTGKERVGVGEDVDVEVGDGVGSGDGVSVCVGSGIFVIESAWFAQAVNNNKIGSSVLYFTNPSKLF